MKTTSKTSLKASLLSLLLLATANVNADSLTVLGLQLGVPLSMPECEKSYGRYSLYVKDLCFERASGKVEQSGPIVTDRVTISFPIAKSPNISATSRIQGTVIDGNLEGVTINTLGVRDQDLVLKNLKEKYGDPKVYIPTKMRTMSGSSLDTFIAGWNLDNLKIFFSGAQGSITNGFLSIDTIKGSEARDKAVKSLSKDEVPL